MIYIFHFLGLTVFMLIYFRLAGRYNILDTPNHRSSHKALTIRGGGILFPIALFTQVVMSGFKYPFFSAGLFIISLVSFLDDIQPLSNKIRMLAHVIGVSLMLQEVSIFDLPILIIIVSYILIIGTINAYNFMDGINGLTGSYSLLILISLFYLNEHQIRFIESNWIIVTIIALFIFNFFNFRKAAKCFAGDVGSVSMAYIVIFFLTMLIIRTQDLKYVCLLLIYGIDSITTIVFRIIRKENIFEAHRSHFYQFMANTRKWPHLLISFVYIFTQLIINIIIIKFQFELIPLILFIVTIFSLFIAIRFFVEGKSTLIGKIANT